MSSSERWKQWEAEDHYQTCASREGGPCDCPGSEDAAPAETRADDMRVASGEPGAGAADPLITEDDVERPRSVPAEGEIEAFDAGWNGHRVGLGRRSVELFTPASGRPWALLGYDTRALVIERRSRG